MPATVEAAIRSDLGADPLDQVLERAKTGDEDAFRDLVDAISPEFTHRLLRGLCPDEDTASAVLQDAWMTSWTRLSSFASTTNLRQWTHRVATNNAITLLRRRRREQSFLAAVGDGTVPSVLRHVGSEPGHHDDSGVGAVRAAIERLPERYRSLAVLIFVHGRRQAEVAELLGLPRPRFRMRLHRARGLLRKRLRSLSLSPALPVRDGNLCR